MTSGPYRYLWIDALTQRVREGGRVVNVSVGDRHRRQRRGAFERSWASTSPRPRTPPLGRLPALLGGPRAVRRRAGLLPRPRRHQGRPSPQVLLGGLLAAMPDPLHGESRLQGPQGLLAASIATFVRSIFEQLDRDTTWAPARRRHRQAHPGRVLRRGHLRHRRGRRHLGLQRLPHRALARRSDPTTPRSASTRRSAGAPTCSASSPTARPSSAWSGPSWPSRPTSGRSHGATWPPSRSRPSAPPSLHPKTHGRPSTRRTHH